MSWLKVGLALTSAITSKRANDYKHELDQQQVERNNSQVQQSILDGSAAIDTNMLRAEEAAARLKHAAARKGQEAISTARAMAAANSIGAGSSDDVFQMIALQVRERESATQGSLTEEFVNAELDRSRLKSAGDNRMLTVGSRPQNNLQTLLDFGKGSMSLMNANDMRSISSGISKLFS